MGLPWHALRAPASRRLYAALVSFVDDYEGPYPEELLPRDVVRTVRLALRGERARTVDEQLAIALEATGGHVFAAAIVLHAVTRQVARDRDARALGALPWDERLRDAACIAPFAPEIAGCGDAPGDTYHYWANFAVGYHAELRGALVPRAVTALSIDDPRRCALPSRRDAARSTRQVSSVQDTRESLRAQLMATWAAQDIAVGESTSDCELRATIRRHVTEHPSAPLLPELLARLDGSAAQIELGAILGEGGMGVVHTAVQTSLGREVAVKMLRDDAPAAASVAQLLREARITGALEHPNVVPVHELGRDEAGRPLIVMKRIEGRPWSKLLSDGSRGSEAFLQRHVQILAQVARALHFAHARQILHRDIKPDNVMIGSFGEIYVVDWGIAVSLRPESEGVPSARGVRAIEGTPVYLAPEMAAGDGASLDERSDVYLLGATLHEIITGAPPHLADTLHAVLVRAYVSEPPEYPANVPPELARIARCALSREPRDRPPSAAALADALDEFLLHRSSARLCEAAEQRAAELARFLDVPTTELPEPEIRALFHEARFAFDQALQSWPENAAARDGRRALISSMVRLELSRGALGAALALLREHDDPPPDLEAAVRSAMQAEKERVARLEALERDADMGLGARTRQGLTYLAALAWGLSCAACGWLTRAEVLVVDHLAFAAVNAGFFFGTVLAMLLTRRETLGNAANRRVAYTTTLVFATGVVLWPVLGSLGVPMAATTMVGAFVAATLWATATFTLGAPWAPMVLGQLLVAVAASVWPDWHFEIFGVVGAAQTALAGRMMVVAGDRRPRSPSRQAG